VDWERKTQWKSRGGGWLWENVEPVLLAARRARAAVLALEPEGEAMRNVALNGLGGLDIDQRKRFVVDPVGFVQAAFDPVALVLEAEEIARQAVDFSASDPSNAATPTDSAPARRRFVSQSLRDEASSSRLATYAKKSDNTLVLAILDLARLRFHAGIPSRTARIAAKIAAPVDPSVILVNPGPDDCGLDPRGEGLRLVVDPAAKGAGGRLPRGVSKGAMKDAERIAVEHAQALAGEMGLGAPTAADPSFRIKGQIADYLWYGGDPGKGVFTRGVRG